MENFNIDRLNTPYVKSLWTIELLLPIAYDKYLYLSAIGYDTHSTPPGVGQVPTYNHANGWFSDYY